MSSIDDDWQERYADRVISPQQAAALVRDGDFVMSGLPEAGSPAEVLPVDSDAADSCVTWGERADGT